MERIEADLLIPGRGDPVLDGCVVIDGPTITYAGPSASAPATPGIDPVRAPVVMPGMWECHGHFWGITTPNIETLATLSPAVGILRAARDARAALEAGFTSVREVGGYGVFLARAIEEGTIPGPTIYPSAGILSQTGGHGDIHGLPLDQVARIFEDHFGASGLCDGPDDCRRAVRRQLRVGAKVIKVCASGGVMSEADHPIHQQFSAGELEAIVDEAARAERAVAAHCHGKPGIMAALRAGVRTIEHGTYLDEEAAESMVEAGSVLVATRFIVEYLVADGRRAGMPDYAYRKIEAIADRHAEAMSIAREAGVTMALGTDMFMTGTMWGSNGRELGYLVDAGLTPSQAIEAATANGPLTVGLQAPRSGILAEGYDADLIAVAADPLADVTVLA
ncbi:MAG: amidohydrolase family protein, partial [Acidimicrobiia bacterium]